jgi:hypothetical protein
MQPVRRVVKKVRRSRRDSVAQVLRGRATPPALLVIAWGLLAAAWAMADPPFAGPDETSHYVRAAGVREGVLVGRKAPYSDPTLSPEGLRWVNKAAREVPVPAGLSPTGYSCAVRRPEESFACQDRLPPRRAATRLVTPVGTYQPLPYLLPGAALRLADRPAAANRTARLAGLVPCLALLALAVWALWGGGGGAFALAGGLTAVTPMVLYLSASLTDSGLEVAAGIAFAALALRLARGPAPARVWAAAGVAGAVLALARPLGPLWIGIAVGAAAALAGRQRLRTLLAADHRAAWTTGGALLLAVVLNRVWEAAYGPEPEADLLPAGGAFSAGFRKLGDVFRGAVGWFGYLELELPATSYVVWGLAVLSLLAAALALGGRRERGVLLGLLAAALVLPPVFYAVASLPNGIDVHGRHMLPLLALLPLAAAEVLRRHADGLPRHAVRVGLPVLGAVVAAVQLKAFQAHARRAAVGTDGPAWFLPDPEWSPPGGWEPWFALAVLGALATLAAAVLAARAAPR